MVQIFDYADKAFHVCMDIPYINYFESQFYYHIIIFTFSLYEKK